MPCCGDKRTRTSQFIAGTTRPAIPSSNSTLSPVEFEYVGSTTLRTVGIATHRDYWFGHPGARVSVDGRDARFLDGIPKLVRVSKPT